MNVNVKIFILNWNGGEVVLDCLNSVSKIDYDNLDIIVIDNNSSDNSRSDIHAKFPDIQIIALDNNYGYAKAYNKAFKLINYSNDSFYMLLNNDTVVDKNIIKEFLNAQNRFNDKNYIFGAKIYYMNNKNLIWYRGGKINLPLGIIRHIGIRKEDSSVDTSVIPTDYITGCCIFTHNSNIAKLNGFDERFTMYCEDVDFSLRGSSLGIRCMYVPSAQIWHKVSHSFKNEFSKSKILLKVSSLLKLYHKHVKWYIRYFSFLLLLIRMFFSWFKLLLLGFYKSN